MPRNVGTSRQKDFFDTCGQCKTGYGCCNDTTPPITSERRKIIEAYLKREKISVENPFVQTDYVFPRLDQDGYCVFHGRKTRKCLIHPVKPETCVAGPITFDISVRNGKIEWFVKMERICQLAGTVYRNEQVLRKHLECAKKEIMRLIDGLDREALRAVLKKDEPETFKIGEDELSRSVSDRLR